MCRGDNLFKHLYKVKVKPMLFGDAYKVAVKSQGAISYLSKNGQIGEIKSNILNIGQLMEKGYSVLMKD